MLCYLSQYYNLLGRYIYLPMIAILVLSYSSCTRGKVIYPETQVGQTSEPYFGTEVPDPYRWLEDDLSEETKVWVEAQNKTTFSYLEKIEFRNAIRDRLEEVFNYIRIYAPFKEGNWYYYYHNTGLQNQDILYRKKSLDSEESEVYLDPNKLSEDGTTAVTSVSFTEDGSLAGLLISEGGTDWRSARVMNTQTKAYMDDKLSDIKFSDISWNGKEGFFYSRYQSIEGESTLSSKTQYHGLYYHRLGTSQDEDQLIFGGKAYPRRYVSAYVTEDQRYLIINAAQKTSGNELYIKDLSDSDSEIVMIFDGFESDYQVIANQGSRFIIQTNRNAPNNQLIEIYFDRYESEKWSVFLPESMHVLNANSGGNKIFAQYLIDATSSVVQYNLEGKKEREIELPGLGTVSGFSGKMNESAFYYYYTSFTYPTSVFKYDISTGESVLHQKPEVDFNPEDYTTKQIFYESLDGTTIPMFIVHKKGIPYDGSNPTYLYGYGGFNISLTPTFSTSRIVWLEQGGVYAQPSLRGGGEYGEAWHKAGTKMKKQNVFDDFIAAAKYLIKEGYTSHSHLAIAGASNGGLLVGAVMAQEPSLAQVALPAVGVLDMLRYHKFTSGAGWASDYGTSEDSAEMFNYLYRYSPYHALKSQVSYPATLITTADHDDRVVPAHSFKFAARLQAYHHGNSPVLIRIETSAGHGAGKPISKTIDEWADKYAFTWYNMDYHPRWKK